VPLEERPSLELEAPLPGRLELLLPPEVAEARLRGESLSSSSLTRHMPAGRKRLGLGLRLGLQLGLGNYSSTLRAARMQGQHRLLRLLSGLSGAQG